MKSIASLTLTKQPSYSTTRKMLRAALVTEGYAVVEAADARATLAVAERRLYRTSVGLWI
jgi:hypothetical protein